jgi:nitroreductase
MRGKMEFRDLVTQTRSYRRFDQTVGIPQETLESWAALARLVPSSANHQALKFLLINAPELNEKVFKSISFAGYLKEWGGPKEGERPTAYVVILGDTTIKHNFDLDAGIAAQTIMLAANADGYGGVMMGAIKRESLQEDLQIPVHFEIVLLLALGKPTEKVVVEETSAEHGIRYYRDAEDVHHVPKRPLSELIIRLEDLAQPKV